MRKILMAIMATAIMLFAVAMPARAEDMAEYHPTCEAWVRTDMAIYVTPADDRLWLTPEQMSIDVISFCIMYGWAADAELAKPAADRDMYQALSTPVVHTFMWYDGTVFSLTAEEMGYQEFFDQWHTEGLM